MKQVLKGGTVVTGSGSFREDVLIHGEKVVAVGSPEEIERLTDRDTGVVDVEGCLLFPGFIDAHTHFDLHVAGTVTADDFATGTKAAVRGGTTTIVDFGTQYT
ncbi:amidohydrolase family protein, partial [Enterocloster citroniae]|nr:amidohydrolase family protein [Enterocloster citroniae]